MKKQLYIKTYGCQMNVYDTNRMTDLLAPLGFEVADQPDEADLVIFNTCHIREKATEKLYSDLGRVLPYKKARQAQGDTMIIAVAGCTAQAEGAEVIRRAPYVDMVFGPQAYHELPEMLTRALRSQQEPSSKGPRRGNILNTEFPEISKFDSLPEVTTIEGPSAFLAIQEGCDKFCHFCVVPYTRGAEYSRPVKDVLQEAKRLVSLGVKEITLLGQNVNAYHGESPQDASQEWTLGRLIREIADMEGVEVIRYTTSHPRDVNEDLIAAHRDVNKLAPYLHLPVQSGSDRILKAMNRKHTGAFYRKIIDQFRDACPEMAFSSDFIVGYPGEEETDHQETLRLIKEVGYAQAYSFKYSKRPGTPAWALESQVPENIKDQRLQEVQALLNELQRSFNQSCVGKEMILLLERAGKHEGQLIGRSPYMQSVHLIAPSHLLGQRLKVKITGYGNNSLTAEMLERIP